MSWARLLALLLSAPSLAQERPVEEDLFGAPEPESRFDTAEEKADPLAVGGTLYLRFFATGREGDRPGEVPLSAPALVDGYLDVRPSERVRGMLLARMRYDPVASPGAFPLAGVPGAAAPLSRPNPSVDLDQLWIRFDLARTAFLTVGKQHLRWGASRFWNPTDFLSPQPKDALAVFDPRLGANMVKLHLPWESRGWNFYALGLLDNAGPADRLGKLGGAARAEVVLGKSELGAGAVLVGGRRPRYGLDFSSALGPLDVYGELALRSGADFTLWRVEGQLDPAAPLSASFEPFSPAGPQLLGSGGATFSFHYTEQHTATAGAEYFFNPAGADTPLLYPWLLFRGQFQPFYAGRHYLGAYLLAAGLPGGLDDVGITVSNLGNLTDLSFVSRLDLFARALTYLSVEAYAAVHYGRRGGELRFGLDLPSLELAGVPIPAVFVPAPVFEAGVGLRVSL